ncbi:fumarylacetoacetate hydrolase family protein [Thermoplasma sp.]|uniref:fumarylacetoacetate hydrolase family protein n=1 Tax=Thermoplasma sp. TaxID=1973142 RepID=UPI002631F6D6|nr:fumarylacetoacetate hydrolase family protein [Thermoplasma sp.]
MKVLNFLSEHGPAGAVVRGDAIYPFSEIAKLVSKFTDFSVTDDLIASDIDLNEVDRSIEDRIDKLSGKNMKDVKILSPVLRPKKILCIGVNYREHAKESKQNVMEYPTIFSKFPDSVIGPGENIRPPNDVRQLDYEGELVLVVGREHNESGDRIFGYTVGNDVSARDLQFRTSQWLLGKALPTFAPIGPLITSKNELGNAGNLRIQTKVNGQIRQDGNTADMIFNVPKIMDYLSRYFRLEPGDLVFTGTPEGVILGMPEDKRVWLKHGDVIEVDITGIGTLMNTVE